MTVVTSHLRLQAARFVWVAHAMSLALPFVVAVLLRGLANA
jgi:hypothetical protein